MYTHTNDERYLLAAQKIASNFDGHVKEQGCYVGDDYRVPNVVSSAWLLMSLFDYYKASNDDKYLQIVINCSEEMLSRQVDSGRWQGTGYASSGNAWVDEVLAEIYVFCVDENMTGCEKYKESIIKNFYWLDTLTYSEDKQFNPANESNANGGIARSYARGKMEIRTDSVAHALNGYIKIFDELE